MKVNQNITGIDFGNVTNGDTNADLDTFLANLDYQAAEGPVLLWYSHCEVGGSVESVACGYAFPDESGGYGIGIGDANGITGMLYASQAGYVGGNSWPAGYQNLTDGKYALNNTYIVDSFDSTSGWNGSLIGVVEAQ